MAATGNKNWLGRLLIAGGIAVALAVAAWRLYGGASVDTENAYIKADKISLSAEVGGIIIDVPVTANQPVKRGDLLVALDDYAFRLAVAEAEGHLGQVRNQLLSRRADYAEAEAALDQARRDADFYQRQLARNEKMGSLAVSEAAVDESRQELARAKSRIAINEQKLTSLRAELGGGIDVPLEEQADLKVAQAQLDRARYQLSRTRIIAPEDGIVASSLPKVGELAHNGLTLISMVSTESLWVEANLKETQLENIHPGLRAQVEVDAYPGHAWLAEVESLSPASGSEFALIPAQNASGNWVKVVQRVPVRLRLLQPDKGPLLRSGLSAEVSIELQEDDPAQSSVTSGKPIALLQ
ncbi:MAG: HlyD family secretion protein [Halieaceae bacterium]|nr:HlyD family secretion protein [Halieaceae bacterium]